MNGLVQTQENSLDIGRNNHNRGVLVKAGLALSALFLTGCEISNPFNDDKPETTVAQEVVAPAPVIVTSTTRPNSSPGVVTLAPGIESFGIGSEGEQVRILQNNLNAIGCTALAVDGEFGFRTEYVIKTFQERAGIYIDGVVGNQVINTLNQMIDSNNTNCGAPADAEPMGAIPASPSPVQIVQPIELELEVEPVLDGDLPYGCTGGPPGPAVLGEVCPNGEVPIPDPEIPLGCDGSEQQGPPLPGPLNCPTG